MQSPGRNISLLTIVATAIARIGPVIKKSTYYSMDQKIKAFWPKWLYLL